MKILRKFLVDLIKDVILLFPIIVLRNLYERSCASEQLAQKTLRLTYRENAASGGPALDFSEVGFRCYSQNDEDGIILYIFSVIGETNKRCIEICAGDGFQCNTANLLLNHGWEGLLIDGDPGNVRRGRKFFRWDLRTRRWQPTFVHAWITRDNVDEIIETNGYAGPVDLLSLDIDGNDYWIWEAIGCAAPRVVVLECNDFLGPEKSLTIPYAEGFVAEYTAYGSEYAGASLPAFVKLGHKKGYRLIGAEKFGFNAFFMRNDVGTELFPEVEPHSCLMHPRSRYLQASRAEKLAQQDWQKV
jgi:hypothetical protein